MIRYNIGTVTVDESFIIVNVNEGYSEHVVNSEGKNFLDNVLEEDHRLLTEMADSISDKGPASLCFRYKETDGKFSWVIALCNKVITEDRYNIQMSIQDISDLEEKIIDNSLDYGTGLLDKKTILEYARDKCRHQADVFNLCILDIDNFKYINDTKGHSFGDEVLKEVSSIIRNVIGEHGKAGRIGGDEIMLVIDGAPDNAALRTYLKPLRETIENLHRDPKGYPLITASIGSARYPTDVAEYDTLFDLADRMLYRAKNRGKNRYVMYNPDIHGKIIDGLFAEENKVVQDAAPVDKTKLVMDAVEEFFGDNETTVAEQLAKIIATYELDYVFVFYEDLSKSLAGYKKLECTQAAQQNGVHRIVEVSTDISFVRDREFDEFFNANGVFVVDSPENQLRDNLRASRYFATNEIKHAFVYKMKDVPNGGYVFFYKTNELSRKFSQPDVTDFTYLGKMIEIALKSR
ncbi:GGDEF domain-containing protein [Butyrivibrio sp. VCB2006]|uniref:GGDEF domain-containing protein n=1 Tax=Butyrivibrio sp. VCB2006 TaxID=1280679 RepID=UPI0004211028|nr:GGDEF domain-containing protein [Butyrivibrio sp. VCB2006]